MRPSVVAGAFAVLAVALPLALAAADAPLGPLCTSLAASFGVSPAIVGSFVGSLPSPPVRTICTWLTQNQTQDEACNFIELLDFGLSSGGKNTPPSCDNPGTGLPDKTASSGILTKLQDMRPLPAEFDNATAVYAEEGATYYQLYRLARNAYAYAPCASEPNASLALPPGWALETTADLPQPNGPALPFLFVLFNNQTNQLLLVLRGTSGSYEWSKDFAYDETSDPGIADIFGGNISSGFASFFEQIWPTAQAAIDDYVINSASPPEVWITGHSLGAGIGTMVAYASAKYLSAEMGEDKAPVVDAVLVAPPQVGDASFVEQYNSLVNGRMVDYVDDVVNAVPCDPYMPACSGTPSGLLGMVGVKSSPTNQGGVTEWPYGTVGGEMKVYPEDMPQDAAAWSSITEMQLCWAITYLQAVHTCSYMCYLSSFSPDPAERYQYCWLSPQPAGAPGTQCPLFPNGWLNPELMAAGPSPAGETANP